jgi:deoxyribonuclease-4
MKGQRPLLAGAHMSIAGGIHNAFAHGERAGCRTLQIFLKSNAQWRGRTLTDEDRELYRAAQGRSGITPVVAHSSYLINLASPVEALWSQSLAALVEEMERARFLGVPWLVLHPGAHMGDGCAAGVARVAAALNRALDTVPDAGVLLENTAGQGSCLGHRFEELAAILDRVGPAERAGVCFDTCHAFAAGYDIRTPRGYRATMRDFDRLIGVRRIRAFHVNDCKRELGCRVDRHAHIGRGQIGLEAFRCLVNDPRFACVPKILETPKGKDLREDRMNLATLRRLVAQGRRAAAPVGRAWSSATSRASSARENSATSSYRPT